MSVVTLRFLGLDEPETFRCRVYLASNNDPQHEAARSFVEALAVGWVETELDDPRNHAIEQLARRAWVDSHFEPAAWRGLGDGRVKVWTLTKVGREMLVGCP
jgi:hypothetical protein